MSTESPSAYQQTAAILLRINRQITTFLDVQETTFSKKDPLFQNAYSPLYQIIIETEGLTRLLIKRVQEGEKNYEEQLQRLQDRLRKHAKNHCEIKLYCQYLEEELKGQKKARMKYQSQAQSLMAEYNRKIEVICMQNKTLKTQLSNAIATRANDLPIQTERDIKQLDTLTKIKKRLLNIGNVQFNQPISCINTLRDSKHDQIQCQPHPFSQPNSFHNSPVNITVKEEVNKGVKPKKVISTSKLRRKSSSRHQMSKEKAVSQSKLKTFKKKYLRQAPSNS